jgi:DNA primase
VIKKETIDTIIQTARIEEVVGDFVSLKRRGVNLVGLCPFHNEKTPSFTVSPSKGIYKCFGCGAAGNAVNFIMNHENLSYPEALKYLAKKYHIPIEETFDKPSIEEQQAQNEKESLYVVSSYAAKWFSDRLWNTDEGRSVALGYFRERGFTDDIIKKFELGFNPDGWDSFAKEALKNGFKEEYLIKSGLCIKNDKQKLIDRFSGRVIFPIHNVTGRVIAFGGRTLKTDKKVAKYINSPETEIYHKSNVLYGLYYAKKAIVKEDNCFLVEGYTDVIALHQAGIENVVASSGTSLTTEQIKQIKRYTNHVTILYDGDAAGIKASFRGIDMILEEGLSVKVLLFPDGEDPDSFARKHRADEVKDFIKNNSKDFIYFKTTLLYEEVKEDPFKKAELVKDIIQSISLISDGITRSVYVRECSKLLNIDEQVLLNELNRIRRNKLKNLTNDVQTIENLTADLIKPIEQPLQEDLSENYLEKEFVRVLINYGQNVKKIEINDEKGEKQTIETTIGTYLIHCIEEDGITFQDNVCKKIIDIYKNHLEQNQLPDESIFIHHADENIQKFVIDLISNPYQLSDWSKHHIVVHTEQSDLERLVNGVLYSLKIRRVMQLIAENQQKLKEVTDEAIIEELLKEQKKLQLIKSQLSAINGGRIVLK